MKYVALVGISVRLGEELKDTNPDLNDEHYVIGPADSKIEARVMADKWIEENFCFRTPMGYKDGTLGVPDDVNLWYSSPHMINTGYHINCVWIQIEGLEGS